MDEYPTKFEPEPIPPRHCNTHNKDFEWIQDGGRQVSRCPGCWAGEKAANSLAADLPLIRYAQDWGRDRAYTRKEQKHRARKPQF